MGKNRPEVLPIESLAIEVACPYCGEMGAVLVGEVRADQTMECDECGKQSPLDPAYVESQIADLERKRFDLIADIEKLRSLVK